MESIHPYFQSSCKPSSGIFLIAEPYLRDPGFSRSVVLLCEHSREGTLGFVLNKPSANTVNMLLPEVSLPGVHIFDGGPVETDTIQIIHRMPEFLGGIEILPDVYWGASYQELVQLCERGYPVDPSHIRLFRGYSGWDAGQLDKELLQYSWIPAPGQKNIIFDTDSKQIWTSSLKSLGRDFAYIANFPRDPVLN